MLYNCCKVSKQFGANFVSQILFPISAKATMGAKRNSDVNLLALSLIVPSEWLKGLKSKSLAGQLIKDDLNYHQGIGFIDFRSIGYYIKPYANN